MILKKCAHLVDDDFVLGESGVEHGKEVVHRLASHVQDKQHGAEKGQNLPQRHEHVREVARFPHSVLNSAQSFHESCSKSDF